MTKHDTGMPPARKYIAASQREPNPWTEFISDDSGEEELGASDLFLEMLCEGAKSRKDDG
jgi:hypothetical protein